jgi:hypothetical protein
MAAQGLGPIDELENSKKVIQASSAKYTRRRKSGLLSATVACLHQLVHG